MADENKTTENMGMSLEDLDFDFDDDAIMKMMEGAKPEEAEAVEAEAVSPKAESDETPKAMSLDDLDFDFDDDAIMKMMEGAKSEEPQAEIQKVEAYEAPKAMSLDDLDFNFDDDAIMKMMGEAKPEEQKAVTETETKPEPKPEPSEPKKEISSFKKKMDGVYMGIRYNPIFSKIFTGIVGKGIGELERLYENPDFVVRKNSVKLAIGSLMIVSLIINERKKGKKKFYSIFRRNPKAYIRSFAASETVKNFVEDITSSHERLEEFGQNYGAEINKLNSDYTTEIKELKTKKMEEAAEQAAKAIKEPENEIAKDPVIHEKFNAFYEKLKNNTEIGELLVPYVVFFINAIEQVFATGAENVKQQIVRDGLSAMMITKVIEDETAEGKNSMLRILKANPSNSISGFSDSNVVKKCAFMMICDQERIRYFANELDANLAFLCDAYFTEVQKKNEAKRNAEQIVPVPQNEEKRREYHEVLDKLDDEVNAIFRDGILSTYIKEAILEGKSALERLYYEHDVNVRLRSLREGLAAMMMEYQIRSERRLGISMTALLLDREPVSCFDGFSKSRTVNLTSIRLLKNPEDIRGFVIWFDANMDALNKLLGNEKKSTDEEKERITEENILEVLKLEIPEPEPIEDPEEIDDFLIDLQSFGEELSKDEATTVEELVIDAEGDEILENAEDPDAPFPVTEDPFFALFGDKTLDEAELELSLRDMESPKDNGEPLPAAFQPEAQPIEQSAEQTEETEFNLDSLFGDSVEEQAEEQPTEENNPESPAEPEEVQPEVQTEEPEFNLDSLFGELEAELPTEQAKEHEFSLDSLFGDLGESQPEEQENHEPAAEQVEDEFEVRPEEQPEAQAKEPEFSLDSLFGEPEKELPTEQPEEHKFNLDSLFGEMETEQPVEEPDVDQTDELADEGTEAQPEEPSESETDDSSESDDFFDFNSLFK